MRNISLAKYTLAVAVVCAVQAGAQDRWPTTSSSGGSFAGVTGTTGNESTLAALYGLKNLDLYPPSGSPVYYFSCDAAGDYPLGSSANAGTLPSAPLLNWADVAAVKRQGVTLRFDCKDTCFTFGAGRDFDITSYLPYTVNDVIARIDSSTVGCQALITQTGAGTTGFTHVHDTGADLPSNAGGTLVVQDIKLASFTTNAAIVDDGVAFAGLNFTATMADGAGEMLFKPRADSAAFCINCGGSSFNNSFIGGDEQSKVTMIGQNVLTMSTPAASTDSIVFNNATTTTATTNKSMTVIGHTVLIPSTASGAAAVAANITNTGTTATLRLARVLLYGASTTGARCLQLQERSGSPGTSTSIFEGYQVTFAECDVGIGTTNGTNGQTLTAATSRTLRYSLFQPNAGVTNILNIGANSSTLYGTWSFVNNLINQDSGGHAANYTFVDAAPATINSATLATYRTNSAATANLATLFQDSATTANTVDQFTESGWRCTADLFDTPACVPGVSNATGGNPDGFCDSSTAATQNCARWVETAICAGTAACNANLNLGYTVELAAPVRPNATTTISRLNLTARSYGAR